MRPADTELEVFNEVLEQMLTVVPGKAGEQAMRAWFQRTGSSWQFVGHPVRGSTSLPGPDGVAWRRLQPSGTLQLMLVDNKQYSDPRKIGEADGLSDRSLARNIGPYLRRMRTPAYRTKEHIDAAMDLLERTWLQVVRYRMLPDEVRRVITNARGLSEGVTRKLAAKNYLFMDIAGRVGGVPPELQELFELGRLPEP
jgi:hypothetical protein